MRSDHRVSPLSPTPPADPAPPVELCDLWHRFEGAGESWTLRARLHHCAMAFLLSTSTSFVAVAKLSPLRDNTSRSLARLFVTNFDFLTSAAGFASRDWICYDLASPLLLSTITLLVTLGEFSPGTHLTVHRAR